MVLQGKDPQAPSFYANLAATAAAEQAAEQAAESESPAEQDEYAEINEQLPDLATFFRLSDPTDKSDAGGSEAQDNTDENGGNGSGAQAVPAPA